MIVVYNIDAARLDLVATRNDTINMPFTIVDGNGDPYVMTGFTANMKVKRLDGLLLKSWSTAGASPEITIAVNLITIYTTNGFSDVGMHEYDLEIVDGSNTYTIMKGRFYVEKDIT